MSDISVIGLGSMGSALAKTLLAAGHRVTGWNRNREKAEALVAAGAQVADSVARASDASPVILVSLRDYATTRELFAAAESGATLGGRILVQLSTGMPQEAIAAEDWFRAQGARYLDGAILGSPGDIGPHGGQILIAGAEASWHACKPLLQCLSGKLQYTGENIDSAAILDLAWLGQRLGLYMGVFQAIQICQAGGVELDVYAETISPDERMTAIAQTIGRGTFDEPVNTVKVWREAFLKVLEQARASGASVELLEFIGDKFERAQAAGLDPQDLAALIKVFENGNGQYPQ